MWVKWFPWRYVIKQAAKHHNFLNPMDVFSQVAQFAQPTEVIAPTELLRAGAQFHARGLINSQAIQHNLDWIWPYWVQCQFNPKNKAFIPRAFSLTHVNLTHRNWTAVGLPDSSELPIVDPRGLLTPFWDGFSIDCWIVCDDGRVFLPSVADSLFVTQKLIMNENISIETLLKDKGAEILTKAEVVRSKDMHICQLNVEAMVDVPAWLAISLRPFNPEGVSFVREIVFDKEINSWVVDKKMKVRFCEAFDKSVYSYYRKGDIFAKILKSDFNENINEIKCHVGMATAAALFRLNAGQKRNVCLEVPLEKVKEKKHSNNYAVVHQSWDQVLENTCRLDINDEQVQFIYDAAVRTLILHSVNDVYPGPYTYKRFWFRDAAFILNALLSIGLIERCQRMIDRFEARQTITGYFRSQEGEWDSNGQVLWILNRFYEVSGKMPDKKWRHAFEKGARWIISKRTPKQKDFLHSGLLPAGFSAEHFGPNDYYYWDDFWSVLGLKEAAKYFKGIGDRNLAEQFYREAEDLFSTIEESLLKVKKKLQVLALPSSPYRRLDSSSIGSIVCGYPLQIWDAKDERLLATVEYLLENYIIDGAFFHDMSHSGLNPYLTLHIAQVLLRAGDSRFYHLMQAVADLASPTGQWPEAVHPLTKGGCMGDGQHVWAAAEWVMMVNNCFVREENGLLILCSGIQRHWLKENGKIFLGPVHTLYGEISIEVQCQEKTANISWQAKWHDKAPGIKIFFLGQEYKPVMEHMQSVQVPIESLKD